MSFTLGWPFTFVSHFGPMIVTPVEEYFTRYSPLKVLQLRWSPDVVPPPRDGAGVARVPRELHEDLQRGKRLQGRQLHRRAVHHHTHAQPQVHSHEEKQVVQNSINFKKEKNR